MEWWHIALIALGGLLLLYGAGRAVYRATSGWRERIRTLKNALDEAIAADSEPPKPRSLSSMESVAMPQILKDFPDFNPKVFAQRVRRDAKTYYESGIEGKVLFEKDATDTFRETFEDRLPKNVGGAIDVHRVSLSRYDSARRRKFLTCQAAVGFQDPNGVQQERRLSLTYVAGYADDPASEIVGFNCPNCGAPLPAVGARVCVYCGTAFSAPVDRGFLLFDAKEG